MDNTIPLNKEEVTSRVKDYISDHRGMLMTLGLGTGIYLLGRQNGVKTGYVKGYAQCFKDTVLTANKAKV